MIRALLVAIAKKLSAALRLCASLSLLACSSVAVADRPNVILIVADDQGYGDFSCHGNPVLKTPNMDQLYTESVRLTDFHVAPMCSPTRGQLMTGRDAMKTGCTAVCQGRSMTRADIPTMANFFADSGYATGHFGKWHMGDSYPHRPQDRGFQETLHHRAWGITSLADYWGNTYFDPVLNHNGVDKKFEGYCTDIFFNHATDWIDRQNKAGEPFFLYLPTNTPHVPNVCAEKYSEPYVGKHEGKPIPDTFYGMIANLDENLGKLETFLKDRNLRDNTILIYMSDNGTQSKQAQAIFNAGMRDRKTSVFEGGHRVPCFVRWPNGRLQHGSDVSQLTEVQDLLPTLIELCDLEQDQKPTTFDGTSLAGLLRGSAKELPDRKLVVQYRVSGEPWDPAVVLWDKWRLIGGDQLYHVGRDPGQTTNVADQHAEIVSAMAAHYENWHAQAKPLFDIPRWITVGTEQQNPMMLYAQDWVGDYCDNRGGLTAGTAVGKWNVIVGRDGVYELELRRWAVEADLPLSTGIGDTGKIGKRPVAAANLQIADANYTLDISPEDTYVTFRVNLKAGKTQLATLLLNDKDETLCSAMYVKLTRQSESAEIALTPTSSRESKGTPKANGEAAAQPMRVNIHKLPEELRKGTKSLNPDYIVATPASGDKTGKLPLLIYLHGGGGTGSDIDKLRNKPILKHFTTQKEQPFVIVIPQCMRQKKGERLVWEPKDLDLLFSHLQKTVGFDQSRVYLTGYSMGGYGTWAWASASPQHFAAIIPHAGGLGRGGAKDVTPDLEKWAERLAPLPIWIFHGARDKVVPAERSERMFAALKSAGSERAKLTVLPDKGHDMGGNYGNKDLYDWLLQHSRSGGKIVEESRP